MTNKLPEALRLAEYHECAGDLHSIQTAALLRTQHALLEQAREALRKCKTAALPTEVRDLAKDTLAALNQHLDQK